MSDTATTIAKAQPRPTNPAEWNAPRLYTLPSGNVARCVRPAIIAMAAKLGYVPNPLAAEVLAMTATTNQNDTPEQQIANFERNAPAFVQVAALALVEPKLVLEGQPDYSKNEIGPLDLADEDYIWFYYTLSQGTAQSVRSFRLD